MKKLLILLTLAASFACQQGQQSNQTDETSTVDSTQNITNSTSLEKIWETDTLLTTSESVIYHPELDLLFVACINGTPPDSLDQDGFISQISPKDGSIINQKWLEGISAPKGMGIIGNSLFVTDVDKILEIDIPSAAIVKSYPVDSAIFLNDISTGADSSVYISDMGSNTIYQIKNQELSTLIQDSTFMRPNGLLAQGQDLYIVSSGGGNFMKLDLTSKQYDVVTDSVFRGDGIIPLGNDNFIVSAWIGQVFHVASNGDKTLLLDTQDQNINTADIWYIEDTKTLYIPTFFKNSVVAYKVN